MMSYLKYSCISGFESRKLGLFQRQFRSVRPARPAGEESRPATAGLAPPWLRHCLGGELEIRHISPTARDSNQRNRAIVRANNKLHPFPWKKSGEGGTEWIFKSNVKSKSLRIRLELFMIRVERQDYMKTTSDEQPESSSSREDVQNRSGSRVEYQSERGYTPPFTGTPSCSNFVNNFIREQLRLDEEV